ncbi:MULTISPECIES: nucleotidyltransferase family protein [unclassified Cryobacterium]|uniref:nucleotidyltransferase family protein n=1 Tax=Cryobacterium sp. Y62 TaxID=2048284 RepID=UPI000CE47327
MIALAAARGATNLRVFGSAARGIDTSESDIDLLADIAPRTGLLALARLERELGDLLGTKVDVVPASGLREHLPERVMKEAVPL